MLNIPSRMEGPEQKTIIGKSEITVSSKGIANGKSVYLNDGADFGPDTKLGATTLGQYGPPYTTSNGVAEALSYSQNIVVLSGNYSIQTDIAPTNQHITFMPGTTIDVNGQVQAINLTSANGAIIKGNGVTLSGFANQAINVYAATYFELYDITCNGSTTPGTNAQVGITINGCAGAYISDLKMNNCGNNSISSASVTFSNSGGSNSNIWFVRAKINNGTSAVVSNVTNSYFVDCSSSGTVEDTWDIADGTNNIFTTGLITENSGSYGITIGATTSTGICKNIFLSDCSFSNSKGGGISVGFGKGTDTQIFLSNCNAFNNGQNNNANNQDNSGIVISTTVTNAYLSNCNASDYQTTKTQVYGIWNNSTTSNNNIIFSGGNYTGNKTGSYYNNGTYTFKSVNCTGINFQEFAITTPALPTGTGSTNAVTNTFPFAVRIFQTGESGTHVVDSNGNDVLLPADPAEVTLDSSDKIYYATTVATSWKWYGV